MTNNKKASLALLTVGVGSITAGAWVLAGAGLALLFFGVACFGAELLL